MTSETNVWAAPFSEAELAANQRYLRAAHAMQTGVKILQEHDAKELDPKHMRVGVNASMRDLASIGKLMMEKGVFTRAEYLEAVAAGMEEEAASYQAKVQALGPLWEKVTLG